MLYSQPAASSTTTCCTQELQRPFHDSKIGHQALPYILLGFERHGALR